MSEMNGYESGTPCWVDLGTTDVQAAGDFRMSFQRASRARARDHEYADRLPDGGIDGRNPVSSFKEWECCNLFCCHRHVPALTINEAGA